MQQEMDVRVAANGRMILPRFVRDKLGVTGSGVVVLSVDGDAVKLTSIHQNIRRAQALYRTHATHDLTVDDFIAERRSEAARDDQD